jgi:hypothetical protein
VSCIKDYSSYFISLNAHSFHPFRSTFLRTSPSLNNLNLLSPIIKGRGRLLVRVRAKVREVVGNLKVFGITEKYGKLTPKQNVSCNISGSHSAAIEGKKSYGILRSRKTFQRTQVAFLSTKFSRPSTCVTWLIASEPRFREQVWFSIG